MRTDVKGAPGDARGDPPCHDEGDEFSDETAGME